LANTIYGITLNSQYVKRLGEVMISYGTIGLLILTHIYVRIFTKKRILTNPVKDVDITIQTSR